MEQEKLGKCPVCGEIGKMPSELKGRIAMSTSRKGIAHGITSSIFDCLDCGVRYESRNAVGLAAKHWHRTGHHIIGEVSIGWSFPKKQNESQS